MADIFEIVGRFAIDGADKAKRDIDDVTKTGEKSSSKFGKFMGGMGKLASTAGKAVGAGLLAGGTAIVALGKQAVSAYGEYEQLVGGVETLFKESANTVIENSAKAYKTAGMSANEYMSTVTSFSASLLQSLGGDTAEASAYADRAITDMSDNANKMGTSMDMIQNAYNGFAKQNYTMLDNLKLGYGGTKTEMERLISDASKMTDIQKELGITVDSSSMSFGNIVNAISVMQKSLDITGTTAKEASSTIQGSISTMKGAWTNLLTGLSDDTQNLDLLISNFIESVGTVGNNLLPRLEVVFKGIAKLISDLAPELINQVNTILPTVLPIVTDGATQIVNAIIQSLPGIIDAIIAIAPQLIDGIMQVIDSLIGALPQILQSILSALPALIPQLIDGSVSLVMMLVEMLPQIIQPIIDNLPQIIQSIVDSLTANLPILIDGLIVLILALVDALPQIIQAFTDATPMVISKIVEALITALPQLIAGVTKVIVGVAKSLPELISSLAKNIVTPFVGIFSGLLNGIKNILSKVIDKVVDWAKDLASKAKEAGKNFLDNLINFFKELPSKITYWLGFVVGKAVQFVKDFPAKAKEAGTNFVNNLINFIMTLPAKTVIYFNMVISAVITFATNMKNKALQAGKNFVTNILNALKNLPKQVKTVGENVVKGIWNGITSSYSWITGKIKEWCGSFVNGFKKALGIHSPSRVMRDEVGKPLVDGVAVGIKEDSGKVSKEFQKMLDDLQLQRDLQIISDAEYYSELEKLRDNHLTKGTKDWWQYTNEIINYENKLAEEQEKNLEELNSSYEQHLKDREDLTAGFYGKLSAKKLYNTFKFTDGDKTTSWTALNVWDDELKFLDEFENKIITVQNRLKTVFAGDDETLKSILDTIRSDPFGEGTNVLDAMFTADDNQLNTFVEGYKKYIEKAKSISNNVYSDDLEALDNNFLQKISEKFANSPLLEQLKGIGENVTESLIDGINSKSEWMKEQILKFCSLISETFNAGVGVINFDSEGITDRATLKDYRPDYTEQLNLINDAVDKLIALVGKHLPDISSKMDRPIIVDGDSLAVGMSKKMDSQLGKISVAKDRGNV